MLLSLIVALDEANGIGLQGGLPWRLPDDQKRFRRLTMGHHVLMGRKTYQSIGRPLAGRSMLVVTRRPDFSAPGCVVVPSFEAGVLVAQQAGENELFVIGGGELYARALPGAGRLYLTRVQARLDADVFFPQLQAGEWRVLEEERHPADERHAYAFSFELWERIA